MLSAVFFIVMMNAIMVNVVKMNVLAPSNCPWLPNFILHDNQHFLWKAWEKTYLHFFEYINKLFL